ncbi:FAD-binding monooxygenase acrE [Cladobotryum mycophilum]|uniref:FAD-binding monooxygenase acrE n=1 Tax=Cladobotryum mycophilum TaxID=491253 RepID=A0ABR0SQ26_9HYPO
MGDNAITSPKKFKTELTEYSIAHEQKIGPYAENLDIDALVVGAGFSGIFMLKTLRDRGLKTYIFEAGNDIGGTWRWNCYPGAGVDSEVPVYEFSWPEIWKTWNWSTNYPDYRELRAYFDHLEKIVGIKKDCAFNTVVVGAHFNQTTGKWVVRTGDGRITTAKYLILGTGFASRRYIPEWPGLDKFKGIIHHTSFWPEDRIEVKVFQRTPNLAVPMRKRELTVEEQEGAKKYYPELFTYREASFTGNPFDCAVREPLGEGGFRSVVGVYKDAFADAKANKELYDFWLKKTRARIDDPRKRDLLAPLKIPHYFGVKRNSLEANYFEQFNRPNVDVIDIRENPIKTFDEKGIILEDGTRFDLDVVALATGFDVSTGGMTQLGLESINRTKLQEEWVSGASTYLGLTVSGYPNMFHIYGPQGTTLFSSGPSCIEVQGRWIADCIKKMESNDIKYINPTREVSDAWKKDIIDLNNLTLFPTARSTYMGGSIPGKVSEPVCFMGGLPEYARRIRAALDDMSGFQIVKNDRPFRSHL